MATMLFTKHEYLLKYCISTTAWLDRTTELETWEMSMTAYSLDGQIELNPHHVYILSSHLA